MLLLNAYHLCLSDEVLYARVRAQPDGEQVHEFRRKRGEEWFYHWEGGYLYALHKTAVADDSGQWPGSQPLRTEDHLPLIAARLVNALPGVLTDCRPQGYRPFSWRGGKNMMGWCLRGLGAPPSVPERFRVYPRYELDAKVVEVSEGERGVVLVFNRGTRWEIWATPHELCEAGIDHAGLVLVARRREKGKRRLVGTVGEVRGDTIRLAQSFDGTEEVKEGEVWVEGTPASFGRCLEAVLGGGYGQFQSNLEKAMGDYFESGRFEAMLSKVEKKLQDASPIYLGGGLSASVGGRLRPANTPQYRSVEQAPAVEYCFDAGRTKRDQIAWRGLSRYGPFSRETFPKRSPIIAVLFPETVQRAVENYVSALRDGVQVPGGKPSAYPGGLAQVYGLSNPKFVLRKVPWLGRSNAPPAAAYRDAVESFLQENLHADLALVALLDEHAGLPDPENPYLYAKAHLLMGGVPVQEIRYSKLRLPEKEVQYINQDMSVAMYAKMGGTPWTVDHDRTVDDEIVIGMGTCELQSSRFDARKRYIGITTVFLGDGSYLVSNLSQECPYEDYPAELRRSVLSSLREVKDRNGWRPGDTVRVVVHIPKPLKNVEVEDIMEGCIREVCVEQTVEFAFLTVTSKHPYVLTDTGQPGITRYGRTRGKYAPARGAVVQVDTYQRLLVTKGPALVKEGRGGNSGPSPHQAARAVHPPRPAGALRAGPSLHLDDVAVHPPRRDPGDDPLLRGDRPAPGPAQGRRGMVPRGPPGQAEVEPVVPVNARVAESFGRQLDALGGTLRAEWRWPSPGAGFAAYLSGLTGCPLPRGCGLGAPAAELSARMDEAPVLAALGYARAGGRTYGATLEAEWAAGMTRLLRRNPFTTDRESFLYRPFELLGLCLGVAGDPAPPVSAVDWFRRTLRQAEGDLRTGGVFASVIGAWAAGAVGAGWRKVHLPSLDELEIPELALAYWTAALRASLLTEECPPAAAMQERLLRLSAVTQVDEADPARGFLIYSAMRRSVEAALEEGDKSPSPPGRGRAVLPDPLATALARGTVTAIVGAGISRAAAGLPGWDEALRSAVLFLREKGVKGPSLDTVEPLMEDGLYAEAAQVLERWLGTVDGKADFLRRVFHVDPVSIENRSLVEAVWRVAGNTVFTTNYDRVLELCGPPGTETVTWQEPGKMLAAIRGDRAAVHLHGVYNIPGSVVLSASDYARLAGEESYRGFSQALWTRGPLLFIGASHSGIGDLDFTRLFEWGRRAVPDLPFTSYTLQPKGAVAPEKRQLLYTNFKVEVLEYGDAHADLEPFLRDLAGRRVP